MKLKVWSCKIGSFAVADLPAGSDAPMKKAVYKAYKELTGIDADFIFSGWGGELDEIEEEIVMEYLVKI